MDSVILKKGANQKLKKISQNWGHRPPKAPPLNPPQKQWELLYSEC